MAARVWSLLPLMLIAVFAGCVSPDDGLVAPDPDAAAFRPWTNITVADTMTFTRSVVAPAVGVAADLYEPTMEVSDTGTIYVAGHVIAAATTGTPAYYSNDDGATWEPLPFLASLQSPPPVQGSQPPPGDEGYIVAGADGQAWMADIYLAGFSVSGWCDNGAELCYDNRQAYDRVATVTAPCGAQASLNDRPWAAYTNGTLLLVNNPGGGPMQIGVMPVPPALPVGSSDPLTGPVWNLCASPDGWIPGIPAARPDGFFAVPQLNGDASADEQVLNIVTGNVADIFDVKVVPAFKVTSGYGGTSNGGRTAFDAAGTLFVGAYNNTAYDRDTETPYDSEGRFVLATSLDDGATFTSVTFETGTAVRSLYLDSHLGGPGALVVWSQLGETEGRSDWYVAHVQVGAHGEPVLHNVTLAIDEGSHSSAHVMGASAGPDGRAYFVQFDDDPLPQYVGSTPISVWIQQEGPALPVGP